MKQKFYYVLVLLLSSIAVSSQVSRHLNIPARLQWDNDGGYCGETSIQMIGLYYGNYISQNMCREIAGGEVLIGNDNAEVALDKMAFNIEVWDYTKPAPQYQNYLVWLKKQLAKAHPVIIAVYVNGETNTEYDHIIPAIGFTSVDTTTFISTDELIYNTCYDPSSVNRTFQSIWDNRSMMGNGASFTYCIPQNIDYACAVTGIKDDEHVTKPVQLSINRWDEPNVSIGEAPESITATIKIDSLTAGENYALLRYNVFALIPSSHFNAAGAYSTQYFTATGTQQTFTESLMSNTSAFYRCVPTQLLDIENTFTEKQKDIFMYPNPCNQYVIMDGIEYNKVEILDIQGRLLQQIKTMPPNHRLDISELKSGSYLVKIYGDDAIAIKKLIKQ